MTKKEKKYDIHKRKIRWYHSIEFTLPRRYIACIFNEYEEITPIRIIGPYRSTTYFSIDPNDEAYQHCQTIIVRLWAERKPTED